MNNSARKMGHGWAPRLLRKGAAVLLALSLPLSGPAARAVEFEIAADSFTVVNQVNISSVTYFQTRTFAPPDPALATQLLTPGGLYFDATYYNVWDRTALNWVKLATGTVEANRVAKTGDFMTGQLTTESTVTVKGNAFSVGGSTFVVNQGNVGVGTSNPVTTMDINGTMRLAKNAAAPFTCDAARDAALAVTAEYTTCICKNGSGWVSTTNGTSGCVWVPFATGGTITTSGGYTIHTFTSDGTFTVNGSGNVEYLVIAGGGGGSSFISGGGGAGGMRTASGFAVTAQAYPITVGTGGAIDANGGDSVFATITATGGGKGGPYNAGTGGSGGSGGGGAGTDGVTSASSGGAGNTPATAPSQGNNGGGATATIGSAGGGGGAGASGGNGSGSAGGAGGNGTASSISGSAVTYAGGGGGGTRDNGSGTGGAGGAGGGGAGGGTAGTAVAGTANTGGGGGGHGFTGGTAAAGGSGIVIIRYLTP